MGVQIFIQIFIQNYNLDDGRPNLILSNSQMMDVQIYSNLILSNSKMMDVQI